MFVSWLRFWLPLLSIAMLLASSIGLAWSIFAVVQVGVAPTERTEPTHAQRLANKVDGSLSFGDFPLDRKYQGPLFDPPPKAPLRQLRKNALLCRSSCWPPCPSPTVDVRCLLIPAARPSSSQSAKRLQTLGLPSNSSRYLTIMSSFDMTGKPSYSKCRKSEMPSLCRAV